MQLKSEAIPKLNNKRDNIEPKSTVVARNLLRLYQYLQMDKPIEETKLIEEMEMNTPNEILRQKLMQIELESQSIYEENHALRQSALQTQIEAEEKVESTEMENDVLKGKIKQFNSRIKIELEKVAEKYEMIIKKLKLELNSAQSKNEEISVVSDGIEGLQAKFTILFQQNETLQSENTSLKANIEDLNEKIEDLEEMRNKHQKKEQELEKKVELQKMVIDGYKRKEQKSIS